MTRIDFYQIDSNEAALVFTCRLIDKIYHRGHQIHIHTADLKQSGELDDLLWSFRPDSFIPHSQCMASTDAVAETNAVAKTNAVAATNAKTPVETTGKAGDHRVRSVPVKISHVEEPDHQDILINISGAIPDFFSRFARVAEVVPLDEASRTAARANYRFYHDRGYPLHYHDMKRAK